jgi:hypothetical protein
MTESATELSSNKEIAPMLSDQLAVLVEECRKQLQERVSEMLSHSAEAHAESLSANWQVRLEAVARNLVQELVPAAARGAVQEYLGAIQEEITKFDERTRNVLPELQHRAALIVEAQSRELAIRAEEAAGQATPQIQNAIEATTKQAVLEVKNTLDDSLHELRRERREIANDSDVAVNTTRGRLQETVDRISREFESRLAETSRTAADSLLNVAKTYEAELAVASENTCQRILQEADAGIREKAGQVLVLFRQELDGYSRSSLDYARENLDQEARESVIRAKTEIEKALALDRDRVVAETQAQIDAASQSASREFEMAWQTRRGQMHDEISSSADTAISEYRKCIESTSSAWLLTSAERLDQNSRELIDSISDEAQTKIAETCAGVFSEFSTNLRQRLLQTPDPEKVRSASAGS